MLINRNRFILLAITIIFLFSCKSLVPLQNSSKLEVLDKLEYYISNSERDYKWFSAKAKVKINANEINGGGRMNIRMLRDSIIWFNIKKVSIEGIRAFITPEEYQIIYRTEKKYIKDSLSNILDYYDIPFSFYSVQDFFAGHLPDLDNDRMQFYDIGDKYFIESKSDVNKVTYSFNEFLTLDSYEYKDELNRRVLVQLKEFDDKLHIFKNKKLTYYSEDSVTLVFEISLFDIEFDVPKKIPFSIPSHYSKH